ncbi:unnamed protein product [Prunus brigantina]
MYGVNWATGAVCGGQSSVEKIWRVENRGSELQVFFSGFRSKFRCTVNDE